MTPRVVLEVEVLGVASGHDELTKKIRWVLYVAELDKTEMTDVKSEANECSERHAGCAPGQSDCQLASAPSGKLIICIRTSATILSLASFSLFQPSLRDIIADLPIWRVHFGPK